MIIITGAAGFIGSYLTGALNREGITDLILADDFSRTDKAANLLNKRFEATVDRKELFDWIQRNNGLVDFIFHIGARTDTTEFDTRVFDELNLHYSQEIWNLCVRYNIPLIYASSAATYGDGSLGYRDDHELIPFLQPLNPYGVSKNEFDKWILRQTTTPPYWYGMKFFNVFGPNEYHKGRMASVVFHAYNQIRENGFVRLFCSHHPEYHDGEQLRDFIYVDDVAAVLLHLMRTPGHSGIYNLGTGKARTFIDLATAVFTAMGLDPDIRFIDTPADIRDKYQYFTQADMTKLNRTGYSRPFSALGAAIETYVRKYLINAIRS